MKKFFSVGEAAKLVGMTAETLRHYDRIGLVKPRRTDQWTKYRYYTEDEIVRLNTVRALRCMDLPLEEIKAVLALNDFGEIVSFLAHAEREADKKIAELQDVKARIGRAKGFYQAKQAERPALGSIFVRELPQRVILLSDHLSEPTMETLWNYQRHFYARLDEALKEKFSFEDVAGRYSADGKSRMFALCTRYADTEGLITLPAGRYLCAACNEQTRDTVRSDLLARSEVRGGEVPFTVELVVLTGILQWEYELQIFVGA